MRMTEEEAAARIAAAPGDDACVLRIEDGDFGCEEHREPPMLWVLVQDAAGNQTSRDLPEPRAAALGLAEGGTCRLEDLHA